MALGDNDALPLGFDMRGALNKSGYGDSAIRFGLKFETLASHVLTSGLWTTLRSPSSVENLERTLAGDICRYQMFEEVLQCIKGLWTDGADVETRSVSLQIRTMFAYLNNSQVKAVSSTVAALEANGEPYVG
ncbi:hypothetical protein SELMODRAFT_425332 [Selaginella moellendorffii]|uniref:Uncharacterized protein n=1 Tax=Selaginella moellendorffii TaxID=88036 RepID=D8SSS0_SELML|nr:hypothetical protein SELMODRAFT_425332 [Selaginella moellendorffii]